MMSPNLIIIIMALFILQFEAFYIGFPRDRGVNNHVNGVYVQRNTQQDDSVATPITLNTTGSTLYNFHSTKRSSNINTTSPRLDFEMQASTNTGQQLLSHTNIPAFVEGLITFNGSSHHVKTLVPRETTPDLSVFPTTEAATLATASLSAPQRTDLHDWTEVPSADRSESIPFTSSILSPSVPPISQPTNTSSSTSYPNEQHPLTLASKIGVSVAALVFAAFFIAVFVTLWQLRRTPDHFVEIVDAEGYRKKVPEENPHTESHELRDLSTLDRSGHYA